MYKAIGLITVFTVGLHWLRGHPVDFICPWYFALFSFGAAGAFVNFSPFTLRERGWNWAGIAAFTGALALALLIFTRAWALNRPFIADIALGAAVASLIVWCTARAQQGEMPCTLVRVLDSPATLWLGNISYSLYLIHDPILAILLPMIRATGWSVEARFYANLLLGSAACLLAAYVFHRCFERPFLRARREAPVELPLNAVFQSDSRPA